MELFGGVHQTQGLSFEKYDQIPVDVKGSVVPEPLVSFDELLPHMLVRNAELSGYTCPTPVQKYAIPIGLRERDMMACAQTGFC